MNKLKEVFADVSHVILPVIHVESEVQTIRNAILARQVGCDGVFLINHSVDVSELLGVHRRLRQEIPDLWIGVNCLGVHPQQVFGLLNGAVHGLWVDNAYIDERADLQPAADVILKKRASSLWHGLYFGGVAFKYQREVKDFATAVRLAARYMDVVTTSGPGTGRPASINKIQAMKSALGDVPLAIASGLTPANICDYLDFADCFLVASGISSSWSDFDPHLVKDFVQTVRLSKHANPNGGTARIAGRFAVIFGTDHGSFPDALNRTRELGFIDVLHYIDSGFDTSHCLLNRYRLSHITLRSIAKPLKHKNYSWEIISELDDYAARSPLSLPLLVGDTCIAEASNISIFEMNSDELHLFHRSLGERLGIPAKEIRLIIVPEAEAGWCRWAAHGLPVRSMHSCRTPDPLSLDQSSVFFISPGNCRAHVFCVFDETTHSIQWHTCL